MIYNVSVVIPVLNGESTIIKAIESVLSQTYPIFEIFVIDNGSTDNTQNLVNAVSDVRVKIISCEKRGVSRARNLGIKSCTGDWIAFLDADDIWSSKKIEREFSVLELVKEKNNIGMIFCLARNQSYKKSHIFFNFSKISSGNLVTTSSVVIKRDIVEIFSGKLFCENSTFAEDWGGWIKISMVSKILFVPENLVFYSKSGLDKYSWETISNGIHNSLNDAINFSETLRFDNKLKKLWRNLILNHVKYTTLMSYSRQKREWKSFIFYLFRTILTFSPSYYIQIIFRFISK